MNIIGWCLCAVKNVSENDPFWVGYVPITKREGTKFWFMSPSFLNRLKPNGPGPYHCKLLPNFFVEGAEKPAQIEAKFNAV